MRRPWVLLFLVPVVSVVPADAPTTAVFISELVASPQTDWSGDGRVTGSDEFVEIHNVGAAPLNLTGWRLFLNDTTPETLPLEGTIGPEQRLAWVNPPGELNNNAHVALMDEKGALVHEVRYGTWQGSTAPAAASAGPNDEALRLVDGAWSRGHATPNRPPRGPMIRDVPPFLAHNGEWFDLGGRNVTARAEWADADREIVAAGVRVASQAGESFVEATPAYVSGRGQAQIVAPTPDGDFRWRWVLTDASGTDWAGAAIPVRIDREAPQPPTLELPDWTNATSTAASAAPAVDVGVGGVQFALEMRDGPDWSVVRGWSGERDFGVVDFQGDALEVRALARDALGNAVAGPSRVVRHDSEAPGAPLLSSTGGYDRIRIAWSGIEDDGSGPAHVLVHRTRPTARDWAVPADAGHFEDTTFKVGEELAYEVRVADHAGNVGPPSTLEVPYEGERPRVRNLRVSKPVWGAGIVRVHADFDRRMDATADADLRVDGDRRWGRWLANHSTYLVELDAFEGADRGASTIRVADARDERGRNLWAPVERAIATDGTAPTLWSSDVEGWVNASGLLLGASDGGRPAVLRYRLGNETEWTTANGTTSLLVEGGLRVRAHALDAAGWRSRELDRTMRLDHAPPRIGPGRTWANQVRFVVSDDESGLNASSVRALDLEGGRTLEPRLSQGMIVVEPSEARRVRVEIRDRVGNVHGQEWDAPASAAAPDVSGEDGAPAHGSGAALPLGIEAKAQGARTVGGGDLAVLGLALVLGLVRVRRRAAKASRRRY